MKRRSDLDPLFGITNGGGSGSIEGDGVAVHGGGSGGISREVNPIAP